MSGFGRKINLAQGAIDEGLFNNNLLNGFGRRLKSDGSWTAGFWKEGNLNGYAFRVNPNPGMVVEKGLYENHILTLENKDIKSYSIESDIIAQEIDLDKCFKNSQPEHVN